MEAAECPPAPEEESNDGVKGEVAPNKSGRQREAKTNTSTNVAAPKSSKGGKRRRSGSNEVETETVAEESPPKIAAKAEAKAVVSPTTQNLKEGMNWYLNTGSVKKEKKESDTQPPIKRKQTSSKSSNGKKKGDANEKRRPKRDTKL